MCSEEKKNKLEDLQIKQEELIAMLVDVKETYGNEPESALLIQNISNASDQVHKMTLRFAAGSVVETNVNE